VLTLDVTNIISVTTITITKTAVVTAETPKPAGATAPDADLCSVTPANLAYFLVEQVGGRWIFTWQSLREVGGQGYNLYHKMEQGWKRLNQVMLSTREMYSDSAETYSTEMLAGDGELFLLEVVDAFGQVRRHGPFVLDQPFGSLAVEMPTNWQAILDEHVWKETLREQSVELTQDTSVPLDTQANLTSDDQKIYLPVIGQCLLMSTYQGRTFATLDLAVEEEGIHRITYKDLLAEGFDWAGVDPESIALLNRGASFPVSVQTSPETTEFGPGAY